MPHFRRAWLLSRFAETTFDPASNIQFIPTNRGISRTIRAVKQLDEKPTASAEEQSGCLRPRPSSVGKSTELRMEGMEGIRRTIPRSARRTPKRETPSKPAQQRASERYIPEFQRKASPVSLPKLRTGAETLEGGVEPVLAFCSAPLTRVRWVPAPGREAIAAVGSGDGEEDMLSLFAVSAEAGVEVRLGREVRHGGKVRGLAVSETRGVLYVGSSDGYVRRMRVSEWETDELADVVSMRAECKREEGVAGVAAVSGMVVAAGEHGSLCGADAETGAAWARQFDEAGFRDVVAVDENGSEVITAGCEVAVWDVRTGARAGLAHGGGGVATCVTGDSGMPQFVMAGTRDGEVCVWDRRAERYPLSRVVLHDGPVWDVGMVSGRAGVLVCCGEDGKVWVVDFAKAATRGGLGSVEQTWCERGEFWRAGVEQSDVRLVGGGDCALAVNSVDVHAGADLFAYASDSGSVGFGRLYG